MSTKSRAVSAKGVEEFKTYITRSIPLNAVITCADNTGAKTLKVIMVTRAKTRLARYPALLFSAWLIPVFGLLKTAVLMAVVNLAPASLALLTARSPAGSSGLEG